MPRDWRRGQVGDAISEVEASIRERKRLMRQLGEDSGHRERLRREEDFLRQLRRRRDDIR